MTTSPDYSTVRASSCNEYPAPHEQFSSLLTIFDVPLYQRSDCVGRHLPASLQIIGYCVLPLKLQNQARSSFWETPAIGLMQVVSRARQSWPSSPLSSSNITSCQKNYTCMESGKVVCFHNLEYTLNHLWQYMHTGCLQCLTELAKRAASTPAAEVFSDFVGSVLDSLIYLLEDSLLRMRDIHTIEQEKKDEKAWNAAGPV